MGLSLKTGSIALTSLIVASATAVDLNSPAATAVSGFSLAINSVKRTVVVVVVGISGEFSHLLAHHVANILHWRRSHLFFYGRCLLGK